MCILDKAIDIMVTLHESHGSIANPFVVLIVQSIIHANQ